jgi:hypothetical protein
VQKDDMPGRHRWPGAGNDLASREHPSDAARLIVHRKVETAPVHQVTIAAVAGGAVLVGVCVLAYLLHRRSLAAQH